MIRFSRIATPAILSAAMFAGLQGCASANRPDSVPAHAMILSEGKGADTVAAASPHDGMVYITDSTDNKLVYSGKVEQGDSIQVNASTDKVLINDRVATDSGLPDSDHYKIYFERSKEPDAQLSSQHQPMTQTPGNTTIIQPAPAGAYPGNNQPNTPNNNGSTTTPPAPSGTGATITQPNGTVVQPNGNVVQPNGTEVKQGENGSTTVVTPSR